MSLHTLLVVDRGNMVDVIGGINVVCSLYGGILFLAATAPTVMEKVLAKRLLSEGDATQGKDDDGYADNSEFAHVV